MSSPILHWVTGGGMSEQQAADLAKTIQAYWQARIPFPVDFHFYRYHQDVHAQINAVQPDGPLTVCGHSFGGCKAVRVSAEFHSEGRKVDHLVLYDPVEIDLNATPNLKGFALTPNVVEAICYTRKVQGNPYSGAISSGEHYKNYQYEGNDHGWAVWQTPYIALVTQALQGKPMLPVNAPKTIVSVLLTYSDGTTEKRP